MAFQVAQRLPGETQKEQGAGDIYRNPCHGMCFMMNSEATGEVIVLPLEH